MITFSLILVFIVTFVVVWLFNRKEPKKGTKQIPGPWIPPFIGNVLQLGRLPHLKFNDWSKRYGDIYQCGLGPQRVIVVSNPKMMKELYMNDSNYMARPHFDGFGMYENERLGIIDVDGEIWEVHRRFLLRNLRDFGFGKSAMEALILEEVEESITRFKNKEGEPISNIKATLTIAVINSLWCVLAGQRFQHDDPKLTELITNTNKIMDDVTTGIGVIILSAFPTLAKTFPNLSGFKKFRAVVEQNRSWYEEMVEEHKKNFQEDNLRDFMDIYLAEVNKTTDPDSSFYGAKAERQLVTILSDLFFAGTETTSATMAWSMLYLCKYPEVQKKFQAEIESVTDNSRRVSIADKSNLPFTMALIDEILRVSSIAPTGVQHRAIEDKEFQGYFIPKNAWVIPNLHYLHHNPEIFEDPENFRPERFLSPDGKTYVKNDNLLPFQIGRRQCIGESLARDTIYLYLTNLFQRFTISFDPNKPEPDLKPKASIILHPQPFSIIMKDRLK